MERNQQAVPGRSSSPLYLGYLWQVELYELICRRFTPEQLAQGEQASVRA